MFQKPSKGVSNAYEASSQPCQVLLTVDVDTRTLAVVFKHIEIKALFSRRGGGMGKWVQKKMGEEEKNTESKICGPLL